MWGSELRRLGGWFGAVWSGFRLPLGQGKEPPARAAAYACGPGGQRGSWLLWGRWSDLTGGIRFSLAWGSGKGMGASMT